MTSLIRLCLTLTGLAGVGSAIGVPLSLNARDKLSRTDVSQAGGGGLIQISVDKCENRGDELKETIDFGSQDYGDVCGGLKEGENNLKDSSSYTSLLQEQGSDKNRNGNMNNNQNQGTQQCLDTNNSDQGAVLDSGSTSGTQHLGFCENTNVDQTKFMKKQKLGTSTDNTERWTVGVCENNCWQNQNEILLGGPRTLQENLRNEANWKQIEFGRKSSSKTS